MNANDLILEHLSDETAKLHQYNLISPSTVNLDTENGEK